MDVATALAQRPKNEQNYFHFFCLLTPQMGGFEHLGKFQVILHDISMNFCLERGWTNHWCSGRPPMVTNDHFLSSD